MKINEIFYSLQGEGARAGEPSIFIRLAGCNLTCGFCDTEFTSGKEMSKEELLSSILSILPSIVAGNVMAGEHYPFWIVWTGGEPTMQLTDSIVEFFKSRLFSQAIETNGTNPVPAGIDFICCSPKVAEHVLVKNFPNGVDELRYVRHAGQMGIPEPKVKAKKLYLSPMFDGNRPNQANMKHCIKLCLENPQWSLSLQLHKIIGVL